MSPRQYTAAEVMAHVVQARATGFRAGVEHCRDVVDLLLSNGAEPDAIRQWLATTLLALPYDVDPTELEQKTGMLRVTKSGG